MNAVEAHGLAARGRGDLPVVEVAAAQRDLEAALDQHPLDARANLLGVLLGDEARGIVGIVGVGHRLERRVLPLGKEAGGGGGPGLPSLVGGWRAPQLEVVADARARPFAARVVRRQRQRSRGRHERPKPNEDGKSSRTELLDQALVVISSGSSADP